MTAEDEKTALIQALSDSKAARDQYAEQADMMRGLLGFAVLSMGGQMTLDVKDVPSDSNARKKLKIRNEDGKIVVEVVDAPAQPV